MNAALLAAAALMATSGSAPTGSIVGTWRTPVDDGTIRIETCGALVCGHVDSSTVLRTTPNQRDVRNSDPTLRGRLIKGLLMMQLHPRGPASWGDGWIYDPQRGRTFKASATMRADGRLLLTGCVVAPLCQTQTWTRVR